MRNISLNFWTSIISVKYSKHLFWWSSWACDEDIRTHKTEAKHSKSKHHCLSLQICVNCVNFVVCCFEQALNLSAELYSDRNTYNCDRYKNNNILSHALSALVLSQFLYHVVPFCGERKP